MFFRTDHCAVELIEYVAVGGIIILTLILAVSQILSTARDRAGVMNSAVSSNLP